MNGLGLDTRPIADRLNALNWQPAPGTPTQEGGMNTLTVSPTGAAQYFRLFKP